MTWRRYQLYPAETSVTRPEAAYSLVAAGAADRKAVSGLKAHVSLEELFPFDEALQDS